MISSSVKQFFEAFQVAGNNFDQEDNAGQFNEVFLHADPNGVHATKKEEFLRLLPQRKAFFDNLGLANTQLKVEEETTLSPSYVLAKVLIQMHFKQTPSHPEKDVSQTAWYILKVDEGEPYIIMYLNCEDVQSIIQSHGLIPKKYR
jgi:hypothetical protein